jgi:DNA-binding NarL/FixJ family response regulator
MPSYLLLRDQVESGPFSIDELKTAGLKSTDLIWIVGQSSDWKYADEIKKLRDFVNYASAVHHNNSDALYDTLQIKNVDKSEDKIITEEKTETGNNILPEQSINVNMVESSNSREEHLSANPIPVTKVIKVIIADDHGLFRQGVKMALSQKKDIVIVGEAENGMQLLHLLKHNMPDIILLDIQMPIMDGISTLSAIRKTYGDIKVIMLSMYNDHSMVTTLMETGANAYLTKTADSESIYEAIKTCYSKSFYFNDLTNISMLERIRSVKKIPGKHFEPKIERPDHVFKVPDLKIKSERPDSHKTRKQVLIASCSILLISSGLMAGISILRHGSQNKEAQQVSKQQKLKSTIIPPSGKDQNTNQIQKKEIPLPISKLDSSNNSELKQNNLIEVNNKKIAAQNKFLAFATIHINNYRVNKAGGISNIKLTVQNKTSYTLNLVVVKVRYFLSDSSLFKTEFVNFKNIPPLSSKVVEAPKSLRAARVRCRITAVKSK